MKPKPYVIIIGGTGASELLCHIYYLVLRLVLGGAKPIPIDDLGRRSIWRNYAKLEERIDALQLDPTRPLVLVGHSQGGILALLYAIHHPYRVTKLVTICTPIYGTRSSPPGIGGALGDMRVGSPFMAGGDQHRGFVELASEWAEEWGDDLRYHLCCVVARFDGLVRPADNALIPGARVVRVMGEHFTALYFATVWMELHSFLAEIRDESLPVPGPRLLSTTPSFERALQDLIERPSTAT